MNSSVKFWQVERELEEEKQRAEDAEKQAKDAIEAKVKELHQIEEDRQREVGLFATETLLVLQARAV